MTEIAPQSTAGAFKLTETYNHTRIIQRSLLSDTGANIMGYRKVINSMESALVKIFGVKRA